MIWRRNSKRKSQGRGGLARRPGGLPPPAQTPSLVYRAPVEDNPCCVPRTSIRSNFEELLQSTIYTNTLGGPNHKQLSIIALLEHPTRVGTASGLHPFIQAPLGVNDNRVGRVQQSIHFSKRLALDSDTSMGHCCGKIV